MLADPTASDPVPDLLESVIGISQYLSVSYWVGEAIELVFDVHPFEWVAEQYAGDWELVQKAGIALENLGKFNAAYSDAITNELKTVANGWQGNAADSASAYFDGLAQTIQDQQDTLNAMGSEFKQSAVGMYETANAIKGLLDTLMDLVIAIGLELAAAAASSWTIIGPILSGAAAAATISKALGVWDEVLTYHTAAWNAAQGLVGLMAGYLSTLGDIEKHALPGSNYDHPGV
ncbi:WXG100 family type VII secretion target [Amycolatopsis aidingensis]|uniref:WXG100 family type VII secretion target n=1 Tax=Amycolatopsis aidingensis TaxID=2842453 RepID=UPI001E2D2BF4|nr:WXG100 family type VII secretion target [Amycolatopsis aidingensis]